MQILVTIAGSLLILPSLIFSATAGELADKFDKSRLTRIVKLVENGIMAIAACGFLAQNIGVLFFALLCIGVQSTFFGPIKLALLPQHLRDDELLPGNAYMEAGTFLAILLGTLAGGLLILLPLGGYAVSLALIAVAVTGYASSRKIPAAPAPDGTLKIHPTIWFYPSKLHARIGFTPERSKNTRWVPDGTASAKSLILVGAVGIEPTTS